MFISLLLFLITLKNHKQWWLSYLVSGHMVTPPSPREPLMPNNACLLLCQVQNMMCGLQAKRMPVVILLIQI